MVINIINLMILIVCVEVSILSVTD